MDEGFDDRSDGATDGSEPGGDESAAPGRHAGPRDPAELVAEKELAEREAERRVSSIEEVRDGGFGMGSAAPLDDGSMPLGHPVKAWHDAGALAPEDAGYAGVEPDVWFTDAATAEAAGFPHAD